MVSGISGFIGRYFLQEIARYKEERPIVISWQKSIHGDILNEKNIRLHLELEKPEVFVHLAWLATNTPNYEGNVGNQIWGQATINVIRICNELGIRSIIAGSVADTQSVDGQSTAYGLAKRRIREYLEEFLIENSTLVRFHYVLSGQDFRPRVLSQVKRNRNLQLENPNSQHDFIHVRDAAAAIYVLIHSRTPSLVDVASGRLHSVKQLRDAFLGESRRPVCDGRCQTSQANIDMLREKLWIPSHTDNFFHRVPGTVVQ